MADFPSVNHLALTVTDLEVSVDWYQRLFDVAPAMDGETNGYRHVVFPWQEGSSSGCTPSPSPSLTMSFRSCGPGWTMSPSAAPAGTSWKDGRRAPRRARHRPRRDRRC